MARTTKELPRARSADDLIVEDLPNELLIYDLINQKAHCLNASAASVFRLCDGKTSIEDIAAQVGQSTAFVELAVEELIAARLVLAPAVVPDLAAQNLESRRRAMKKMLFIAGVAVALPMVQSIVAPSVAQAASCLPSGAPCMNNTDCCSGACAGTCG